MKKVFYSLIFGILLFFGLDNVQASELSDGTYRIQSALKTEKVLDVKNGSSSNGTAIQLYDWNTTSAQTWNVEKLSNGYYKITSSLDDNKVLDVKGAGTSNGTKVQLYTSNNTKAQQWIIKDAGDGYYYIISRCNNLYVDVKSAKTSNGTTIQMYKGNSTKAQKFRFIEVIDGTQSIEDGTYTIANANDTTKGLDVTSSKTNNSTNIRLYEIEQSYNQIWNVKYLNNGYYSITTYLDSSKSLDVKGGGTSSGTNVQLYDSNGTKAQQWIIKDAGDGYYYIISRLDNMYLDVKSGSTKNGANIQIYLGNGTAAQKFKFTEVTVSPSLEDGMYTITNANDETKGLDVTSESTSNGTNIELFTNGETYGQIWNVEYLDNGYYKITSYLDSNKSLDVYGGNSSNGTNVQLYTSNNTKAQQWIIKDAGDGYYYIISKINNMYLDVKSGSTSNGANIQIYTGNETDAQKFKFTEASVTDIIDDGLYTIDSALDYVANVDSDIAYNGANVNITSADDSNTQKWYITYIGNGYYKIASALNSNKVLDVKGGGTTSGTNVQVYSSNSTDAQSWFLKSAEDGYYYFVAKNSKLYLDVEGTSSEDGIMTADLDDMDGTNVQTYSYQGSMGQKFELEETTLNEESNNYTSDYADGYYVISSALNSKYVLDISGGSKLNNTNVQIYSSNSTLAQIWYLKNLGDGYYRITSSMNPTVVSLNISSSNADIYKYSGSDSQKWLLKDNGDGSVSIVSASNGQYLNVDGSAASGTNVTLASKDGTDAQKFNLTSYTKTKVYTGIDVSKYQGDINWSSVANTNLGFVIIRAGYGSDWTSQDDAKLKRNVQYCEKYNIPYGIYLYSYATDIDGSNSSATSEAKHVLRLLEDEIEADGYSPTLGTKVFLDMEDSSTSSLGKTKLTSIADTFCSTVEDEGYPCGIYANVTWLTNYLDTKTLVKSYDIWVANYFAMTSPTFSDAMSRTPNYTLTSYKYWQFASDGVINGISGYVDLDLGYDVFD